MKIHIYEVDDNLILQYCRIIKAIEKKYSQSLEETRTKIHNEIFDSINVNKAGVTRDDRKFILALSNTVADLCFINNKL